MATLVLSAAGAAVGGLFGPVGIAIGRAVGAIAGYAIDQSLFAEHQTVKTGRLADLDIQTSREGAPMPRVYGRVRIAGQIIWATHFEEEVSKEKQGGKGGSSGTTVKRYSYYGNFAVGLSEGPIDRIGRVWADGRPFNMAAATYRIYTARTARIATASSRRSRVRGRRRPIGAPPTSSSSGCRSRNSATGFRCSPSRWSAPSGSWRERCGR